MAGETFSSSLQNPPVSSQPLMDNLRLAFGGGDGAVPYKPAAAPDPASVNGGIGGPAAAEGLNMNVVGEPVKKKRGRPRKYGPEGSIALALNSGSAGHAALSPPSGGFGSTPPPPSHGGSPAFAAPLSGDPESGSLTKRRGRPPGSSNKKRRAQAPGNFLRRTKCAFFHPDMVSVDGTLILTLSGGLSMLEPKFEFFGFYNVEAAGAFLT